MKFWNWVRHAFYIVFLFCAAVAVVVISPLTAVFLTSLAFVGAEDPVLSYLGGLVGFTIGMMMLAIAGDLLIFFVMYRFHKTAQFIYERMKTATFLWNAHEARTAEA